MDKLQIYAAQLGLSTITATIASKCGLLGWMLVAVAAAMVIDFLAGMAASAKEAVEHPDDKSYGWNDRDLQEIWLHTCHFGINDRRFPDL